MLLSSWLWLFFRFLFWFLFGLFFGLFFRLFFGCASIVEGAFDEGWDIILIVFTSFSFCAWSFLADEVL